MSQFLSMVWVRLGLVSAAFPQSGAAGLMLAPSVDLECSGQILPQRHGVILGLFPKGMMCRQVRCEAPSPSPLNLCTATVTPGTPW